MTLSLSRASHHVSPLRYPGGKAKLSPFFKNVFRTHKLLDGVYVEPFAGGAGVGLSLLLHGYVSRIVLNDLSIPIYSFWRAMLDDPGRFEKSVMEANLTTEEWLRQKKIFQFSTNKPSFELGFSTFYLNRTNHSGVLNGGMIGGHSQNASYGLDARFNKEELIARIRRVARNRANISLLNIDAAELIKNMKELSDPADTLIYIDPPYFRKGRDLYYDFYKSQDHINLRNVIASHNNNFNWVVTYDNEPDICNLYENFRSVEYDLSYSVRNGRVGREVMFLSDSLGYLPVEEMGLPNPRAEIRMLNAV